MMTYEEGRDKYPCTEILDGLRCNGQARPITVMYRCDTCGAKWDLNGEPKSRGKNPAHDQY